MTFKEHAGPTWLGFIIRAKWNYSQITIKAESNQKSKWLKSTLPERHANCFTYRPCVSLHRCRSPAERGMMMMMIMIVDLCALLFCQMNKTPAVFSWGTHRAEWAVHHQNAQRAESRKWPRQRTESEFDISWAAKTGQEERMCKLGRLHRQRRTRAACQSWWKDRRQPLKSGWLAVLFHKPLERQNAKIHPSAVTRDFYEMPRKWWEDACFCSNYAGSDNAEIASSSSLTLLWLAVS